MKNENLLKNENMKNFIKIAIKMWTSKFKREYQQGEITNDNNTIYIDEGFGKTQLVKFNKDNLTILGSEGEINIKYIEDELKFIRSIQKKAKEMDIQPLKNLKALRDNIELREYDRYEKYEPFFIKLDHFGINKNTDSENLERLGINHIDIDKIKEGDIVYSFEIEEITIATPPIMRVKKVEVSEIRRKPFGSRINEGYDIENTFKNKKDAEISYIYSVWARAYFLFNKNEHTTKYDKVTYVKNMKQFEKWYEKFNKEFDLLEKKLEKVLNFSNNNSVENNGFCI